MFTVLAFFIIGLFAAMVFLNFYFRIKVFRAYTRLVQDKVEFGAAHIFNRAKMESEILPKYPTMQRDILDFARHMRYAVSMATILVLLITAFGALLMWFRN